MNARLLITLFAGTGLTWAAGRPDMLLADGARLASPMELKLIPSKTSSVYKAKQGE